MKKIMKLQILLLAFVAPCAWSMKEDPEPAASSSWYPNLDAPAASVPSHSVVGINSETIVWSPIKATKKLMKRCGIEDAAQKAVILAYCMSAQTMFNKRASLATPLLSDPKDTWGTICRVVANSDDAACANLILKIYKEEKQRIDNQECELFYANVPLWALTGIGGVVCLLKLIIVAAVQCTA